MGFDNEKMLFGENTGKIKTFAVMSADIICENVAEMKNHLHCFKADLEFENIQYTEIGNNIYILYNLTQHDTADFAYRCNVKSFLYGENTVPSEITLYKGQQDKTFITDYQSAEKINISSLKEAEEVFSKNGLEFDMNEDFLKSVQSADNDVVDENELIKSLQQKRSYSSRHMHRQSALGKADKRMSVIFAKSIEKPNLIKHRLRVINPHFQIYENIKLSIPDKYWFDGAVRVYDAYKDRERFLKAINGFAEICEIDGYFIVDKNDDIWHVDLKNNTTEQIFGMEITDNNAHRVGNIMSLALASVLNGCPSLKEIIDIAYVK